MRGCIEHGGTYTCTMKQALDGGPLGTRCTSPYVEHVGAVKTSGF